MTFRVIRLILLALALFAVTAPMPSEAASENSCYPLNCVSDGGCFEQCTIDECCERLIDWYCVPPPDPGGGVLLPPHCHCECD